MVIFAGNARSFKLVPAAERAKTIPMKLHHAAVLALVSWALIFPPMAAEMGAGTQVDIVAPLNEWEVVRKGFATAQACEEFRAHGQIMGYANLTERNPNVEAPVKAFPQRRAAGRCTPADDPRLKGR
jgi:hypothetical protein